GPLFVMPHAIVLLLAALAAITFLVEGAMLDWGALLLVGAGLVREAQGGLGYMLFSIAMTAGRLGGDAVVARVGDRATLVFGSLLAIAGFAVLLVATVAAVAMAGFVLIGLGASNLVPVLFRRAGAQKAMPAALAIACWSACRPRWRRVRRQDRGALNSLLDTGWAHVRRHLISTHRGDGPRLNGGAR